MKILDKQIAVGGRVKLLKPIKMLGCTYGIGHEFNVIGEGERGFDFQDDDGNQIRETRLCNYKVEIIK